ncbi:Zinc finger C2H2 [Penicillium lagena]|uniref:Zinc finger C2H2 n=1 Tax=Penicillium lagena TaxID=94218 RepID=UPI00253FECA6|nr:Zinc finger C2H2 [Penicillium lagena]KAJ5624559.1 Zinc finger C2H2 [Penicillium lagena]
MSPGNLSSYTSSSPLPSLYPALEDNPAIMNNMNNADQYHITSGASMSLPTTYTPTTHRVSKAKKGKRVHVCEYPGCQKVFTRAEHRRRHEMRHYSKKSYPCTFEGCKRTFHRSDYLTRHLEKHESGVRIPSRAPSTKSNSSRVQRTSHLRSTDIPVEPIIQAVAAPTSYPNTWTSMETSVPSTAAWFKQIPDSVDHFYCTTPELSNSPIPTTDFASPAASPPSFLYEQSQILDPYLQGPASDVDSGVDSPVPWEKMEPYMLPFQYGPVPMHDMAYPPPCQYTSWSSPDSFAPLHDFSASPLSYNQHAMC